MLMLSEFNLAHAAARAGAVAVMIMFMFLAPAYPGVRWMVDGFLPMGTVWSEVAGMFAAAVFLTGWFLVIWKSSKLAAEALQKEIAGCD